MKFKFSLHRVLEHVLSPLVGELLGVLLKSFTHFEVKAAMDPCDLEKYSENINTALKVLYRIENHDNSELYLGGGVKKVYLVSKEFLPIRKSVLNRKRREAVAAKATYFKQLTYNQARFSTSLDYV